MGVDPETVNRTKGVQLRNPEAMQAIRANLQIGSRESGHLSESSRRLWLSEIPCWKRFPANSTLLENSSPIFRQHELLSLPRFGHLPARKTAAGKLAAPSGTLLDFLLRDRHSLLEFF